jgi:2-polyprenyl-6-methoxyphenol hydroxylase-like FAD-dependent oxidoreductase
MSRTAVIVGAGIGGLAAGIALGRAGWSVRIVERASSPRELGFALALAPNAMAALRELGVAGEVGRQGAEVDVFEVRRADGALLKRIDFRAGTARSMVTLRPALHGTLLDAVGPSPLLLGRAVEGFTIGPAGAAVQLTDGTSLDAGIIIGADGVGSVIRRGLHTAEPAPRPSGYYALRGVTHDLPSRPGDASTTVYLGDGIEAGAARASATAVYWYMSLVDEYVHSAAASAAAILEACTRGMDERFVAIARGARSEDLRLERLWVRDPIDEWGREAVTLLGDAAHPVLPHTAQGAALALEDAVALGLALAPEGDPVAALRRYERVRSRRTRRVVSAGPWIAAMTTTRSRARILARNAAIRLLPGSVLSGSLNLHARDPHRPLRG